MVDLKNIIQALLLSNNKKMLSLSEIKSILPEFSESQILKAIGEVNNDQNNIYTIFEVSGMYYVKIKSIFNNYLSRMHHQNQIAEHSKIFLETIAVIAMYQPLSRDELEHKINKKISEDIFFQLQDLHWIKITVAKFDSKEYFSTTKEFLQYFNIASVIDLEKKLNAILLDNDLEVVW